jgi:hypothetical protein
VVVPFNYEPEIFPRLSPSKGHCFTALLLHLLTSNFIKMYKVGVTFLLDNCDHLRVSYKALCTPRTLKLHSSSFTCGGTSSYWTCLLGSFLSLSWVHFFYSLTLIFVYLYIFPTFSSFRFVKPLKNVLFLPFHPLFGQKVHNMWPSYYQLAQAPHLLISFSFIFI